MPFNKFLKNCVICKAVNELLVFYLILNDVLAHLNECDWPLPSVSFPSFLPRFLNKETFRFSAFNGNAWELFIDNDGDWFLAGN